MELGEESPVLTGRLVSRGKQVLRLTRGEKAG